MSADKEQDEVVLYSVEGAVARVTLNRPEKRNALNDAVIAGIKEGLKKAGSDGNVKAVVISGAGKDFCSGAD
ncbi:MAG TPA: enoyl-CoA hydratase-related protein, partial [Pyrinomonadaceae bacterium]|nr:enoyl-CoA hydratase-related protein [Pyrinomonadaceae bacterium]